MPTKSIYLFPISSLVCLQHDRPVNPAASYWGKEYDFIQKASWQKKMVDKCLKITIFWGSGFQLLYRTEWGRNWGSKSQVYTPTTNAREDEIEQFYEDPQDLLELTPKKDVLFIIRGWNAKVGSQEITGVTDKFGLGVQNEGGQRLTEFCLENILVMANTLSNNTRDNSTHGHHQMVNTEIRLITLFAAPKMEELYTVSKNKIWSWLWLRSWAPYWKIQT